MTQTDVETMLGRKLKKPEKFLFDFMKDDNKYIFIKDNNGGLRAVLKETNEHN